MTKIELLNLLTEKAKECRREALLSIRRNRHMNDLSPTDFAKLEKNRQLTQKTIDAILVDFINGIGVDQGVDYGLRSKHLKKK